MDVKMACCGEAGGGNVLKEGRRNFAKTETIIG